MAKVRYLAISEVCALLGLTPRAVRYYEERGLVSPSRDHNEVRRYTELDRRKLRDIAHLRRAGLSIEDIRQILAKDGEAERTASAVAKLEARRGELVLLQDQIERILAEVAAGALIQSERSDPDSAPGSYRRLPAKGFAR